MTRSVFSSSSSLALLPAAVGVTVALAACGSSGHGGGADPGHAAFLRFSVCMRSHGVPNFPDPSSGGGIQIQLNGGSGLNPSSPSFQSAQQQCRKLLPGGGPPRTVPESQKLQALKFAQCMRTHGVPNFPDPTFSGGGLLQGGPGAGIDPSSPAFEHAQAACSGPNHKNRAVVAVAP